MSRQQQWAESAFKRVAAVKDSKDKDVVEAKYRTHALKFPSHLMQSGLVQALTFVDSRDESGKRFVTDLAQTLVPNGDRQSLLGDARKHGVAEYVRLAADVLAAAAWFRRFAQAELKGKDD